MNINPEQKKEIERIISTFKCSKDFECYKSGFENPCKAMDMKLNGHVRCLEKKPVVCQFGIIVENVRFCSCPLRIYVAREFDR